MHPEYQQEMSRPTRITLVAFILGVGGFMLYFLWLPESIIHEHRHQVRIEEMKKHGALQPYDYHLYLGQEFDRDSGKSVGQRLDINPKDILPPPPEPPDFPLPAAK